jgi:3-oxoacyl-[acyl-carrier protein] reductase
VECEAERSSNGPVSTELSFEGKTPKQIERMTMLNPFKRLVEPEDIARVVFFLLMPCP